MVTPMNQPSLGGGFFSVSSMGTIPQYTHFTIKISIKLHKILLEIVIHPSLRRIRYKRNHKDKHQDRQNIDRRAYYEQEGTA